MREDVVEEGSEGLEENVGSVLVTVIGNMVIYCIYSDLWLSIRQSR